MSKLAKALTAAAGNAGESLYVEDVFSTYLYDGVSSAITITNGIDLADAGGLVWTKRRATDARSHILFDSERGASSRLMTDQTAAAANQPYSITMNSNGYSWSGADNDVTIAGSTYASWTFRKAEKFFDVVTWTGDGSGLRQIAHSLNGTVGSIIGKATSTTSQWFVYHKDRTGTQVGLLNGTNPFSDFEGTSYYRENSYQTTTEFGVGSQLNASGVTYVAYLFASDAGGFGDDGSESIIKCGSYTGTGGELDVSLGFEPQYIVLKRASGGSSDWLIFDAMRGVVTGGNDERLEANDSAAANSLNPFVEFNADGFRIPSSAIFGVNGSDYIYIAIRRPMKTPESGTEVFAVDQGDATSTPAFNSGFVTDFNFYRNVNSGSDFFTSSRLTGNKYLATNSTAAESSSSSFTWDFMDGFREGPLSTDFYSWMFKRATGFFDVVAYTGDDVNPRTITHNLGAVPEMLIFKCRNLAVDWKVHLPDALGNFDLSLNKTNAKGANSVIGNLTSSTFTISSGSALYNDTSDTYIAYLFATLAGVSKVGSYTGTGSNVDVDCGFSAGARFILIKRSDSTGDWYVWDSVRGIVAGNDPYILLNSTATQVTSTDYIDPLASGFTVTSSAPAALNASGGTYIFLAIA